MEQRSINRCIYKMVGVNGVGKVQLIYIGQTSNFERRVEEHKANLRLALCKSVASQRWLGTKYRKLRDYFAAGRVYFEKIDQGLWTWEEALVIETQYIIHHRYDYGKRRLLNALESPNDGMMPNGPAIRDATTGEIRISLMQGLQPGDEAILGSDGASNLQIVKLVEKRTGSDRGLETWTFTRTGLAWTVGALPREIGERIYRGPLLAIYRNTGRELRIDSSWHRSSSGKDDKLAQEIERIEIAPSVPEHGKRKKSVTPPKANKPQKPKVEAQKQGKRKRRGKRVKTLGDVHDRNFRMKNQRKSKAKYMFLANIAGNRSKTDGRSRCVSVYLEAEKLNPSPPSNDQAVQAAFATARP